MKFLENIIEKNRKLTKMTYFFIIIDEDNLSGLCSDHTSTNFDIEFVTSPLVNPDMITLQKPSFSIEHNNSYSNFNNLKQVIAYWYRWHDYSTPPNSIYMI